MTPLEYNQKLREAKEIAFRSKWERKTDRFHEKMLNYMLILATVLGLGMTARAYADYTVIFYICSICQKKNSEPSCCYGAHFTEFEYTKEGEPPPIWD